MAAFKPNNCFLTWSRSRFNCFTIPDVLPMLGPLGYGLLKTKQSSTNPGTVLVSPATVVGEIAIFRQLNPESDEWNLFRQRLAQQKTLIGQVRRDGETYPADPNWHDCAFDDNCILDWHNGKSWRPPIQHELEQRWPCSSPVIPKKRPASVRRQGPSRSARRG